MIKNLFKKIKNKIQEKTGASMAIVITTMSLLIIMGTSFSTIAYNAYKHSYGTICRQQAMYTAKSILDGFVDEFINNGTLRSKVGEALFAQVNAEENKDKPITEVKAQINIAGLHDYMVDQNIVADGVNTSDCKMYVSYSDETRSKLRLLVSAKYKGFENALSVILAYTNKASVELSKIMTNTLFFTSPIVDLMYYVDDTKTRPFKDFAINGDVYIDKPMWKEGDKNPYENISSVPNEAGATYTAVDGHTLAINNEGRPNILYGTDGYPVPKKDKDGNKIFVLDKNNQKIPMRDDNGDIIYEKGERLAYLLEPSLDKYLYKSNNYELVPDTNFPVPLRIPEKNKQGHFIGAEHNTEKNKDLVEKQYIKYRQNDGAGTQYDGKTDVIGRPILGTILNEDPRLVVDNEKNGEGWDVFECEQYKPEDTQCFVEYGDSWCWIEIFKTIDPVTKNEIYVTGRENHDKTLLMSGEWKLGARSFKRVEFSKWTGPGSHLVKKPLYKFVAADGKTITNFSNNLPNYNIYKYQRERATIFAKGDTPKYEYVPEISPNQWTEVYLRSHYWGGIEITNPMPVVIDGNLKCNTDVLLGLNNRSLLNKGIEGYSNGEAHGFKNPDTKQIVPVSFDTNKDDYKLPLHNVLSLTGDIFVNGNAKGENLWVGGSLYAKDNNPKDDDIVDARGWKPGCKGNIFLEQASYSKLGVTFGAYMDIKKDIVADGYVFMGGVFGDIVDKVVVGGDIHAGKYNADGTKWGNVGVGTKIPVKNFYMEEKSKWYDSFIEPIEDDKKQYNDFYPAGIYGYRTNTEEVRYQKKNRYRLGSGDVVLQQTHVKGSIYATGDVYLSNGTWVDGDIYTPGNVYITKGDAGVTHNIEYKRDARCRVFGNIYAGGDVVVTGGCEVGDYKATAGEKGYKSNIYCGGNFYSSGRISGRGCDILSGSLYCAGNATIYGANSVSKTNFSRLGYNGGNIRIGGNLVCDEFVAISNDTASVYVGGDVSLGNCCALDNHGPTIIEGDFTSYGCYLHTNQLFVGGDFTVGGETEIYKHAKPTTYYIMGNITKTSGGLNPDTEFTEGDGTFNYYLNGTQPDFVWRFVSGNNKGKITSNLQVNISEKIVTILNNKNEFSDELKPEGWELLDNDEYSLKINNATIKDLTYFKYEAYKAFLDSYSLYDAKLKEYQYTVDAKIREWTPPESTNTVYKTEYEGEGINGNEASIFRDKDTTKPNHFIIDDSVFNMSSLTLLENQRLTIDTSKKNIHIVLNSNLVLGPGAKLEIKGKNMAFIYFTQNSKPWEIQLGEKSSFGEVIGIDPNENANHAGLHIVATQKDFRLTINKDVTINSYNYMPRGILDFNLSRPADAKERDPIIANPSGSYVVNRIEGLDLRTMDYWRIKFLNTKSPLILDINGNINYGDNAQEIIDFKGVEWVVVNYN